MTGDPKSTGEEVKEDIEVVEETDKTEDEMKTVAEVEDKQDKEMEMEDKVEEVLKIDVQKATPDKSNLDSKKKYLVVCHFLMPGVVWNDETTGISWIGLPNTGIRGVTDYIKTLLTTTTPTNIIILAYQAFIGNTDVSTIEKHLNEVVNAAINSGIHNVVYGTIYHVPIQELVWPKVLQLNQIIRLLTLDCGRPPLSMHKAFLRNVKVQYVRPELWAEFTNGQGVGSTPSWAGLEVMKNTILKYCYAGGFEDIARPMSKYEAPDMTPPALCFTYEYKNSPEMMVYIRMEGLRVPVRPTGSGNQGGQHVGVRITARQMNKGGKGNTFKAPPPPPPKRPSSVSSANSISWKPKSSVQQASTKWTKGKKDGEAVKVDSGKTSNWAARTVKNVESDEELTDAEQRTKRFLEEKSRKRAPSESAEDLAAKLEKMRIDGVNQSKRSKIKYERFEDEIKDLKRKIRKMDENEIRMKDEMDDKDRKIKKLQKELAKADVEADEWQDAYEKLSAERERSYDGGKRRRRY